MNIFRAYKRTRFFLWINIIGLATGLTASIMLALFVINELSYDKHFKNSERIVRLNTIIEERDQKTCYGINLRKAYSEVPEKVPGVEAAMQIYYLGDNEIIYQQEHFNKKEIIATDPEFFKVFELKFIEGSAQTALQDIHTVIITDELAQIMFGSAASAINKTIKIHEQECTISGVVEKLPLNTHFSFDLLINIKAIPGANEYGSLEFYTYYLIKPDAPLEQTRAAIEKENTTALIPFSKYFNAKVYAITEMLEDIYLHTEAQNNLGRTNSMSFIWQLIIIAVFILLLAITNFINLFIAQGETRMAEIGIRKANGAESKNIIQLFFREVSTTVLIAFILGFVFTIVLTPYFAKLIHKEIDLIQLANPYFIVCLILLFIVTVTLSAAYPSFYLSRFDPLDILAKRLKFSKRRLTTIIVVFQSVVTIVLISYILIINRQANHLQNLPVGYKTENVMCGYLNMNLAINYKSVKEELLKSPDIELVSSAQHIVGGGTSGQLISLYEEKDKNYSINEYRVMYELCELMEFQLVEGEFFKENAPDSINQIILNEAAVKMLNLTPPVAGKIVNYKRKCEITGVVKDFCYNEPENEIAPILFKRVPDPQYLYIRFANNVDRVKAHETAQNILRGFDSEFMLSPIWLEDSYAGKFENIRSQSQVALTGTLLSMFIAMLGLLATHMYTAVRRTKEIGIRRVNGATMEDIFLLLSKDVLKWVIVAGLIATPITYYIASDWLQNYANRISINWIMFVLPVLVQCLIAIVVTSGISIKVLMQNPVESLKKD